MTDLLVDDRLFKIRGLTSKIPISSGRTEIVIEMEGSPKVFVRLQDGRIDQLFNDEQLRKAKFDNGKVMVK